MKVARARSTLRTAAAALLRARRPEGYWEGRLSSSALSTATATSALALAGAPTDRAWVRQGAQWLAAHQNADGGWGDTPDSPSNLSTTLLCVAAMKLAGTAEARSGPGALAWDSTAGGGCATALALEKTEAYLTRRAGISREERCAALQAVYGKDRTFAVPIMMNCALAGLLTWESIPPLPFELAFFPQSWYRFLRLHVVSYALPALIAIGLCLDRRQPPRTFLVRAIRRAAENTVLTKLRDIQPYIGGYRDAIPLTCFATMGLIAVYGPEQPVARSGLAFIRRSRRDDGSWPIDSNLSVWLTTAAVLALDQASACGTAAPGCAIPGEGTWATLRPDVVAGTRAWLIERQHRHVHPFTGAEPGAWTWTHLSGGVPDADDTSGALLALTVLGERGAVPDGGRRWLLRLQNSDGGWPTFCRGWGRLPFDRSGPDITAHVMRALHACDPDGREKAWRKAQARGLRYLSETQSGEGTWDPLWFGNQGAPRQANPVFGTARVLRALEKLAPDGVAARRALVYLMKTQNPDGGWGGAAGLASTIEETAQAVAALAGWAGRPEVTPAAERGAEYLAGRVEDGTWTQTAPIGLYFAKLWYSEELYPVIWTVEALARAVIDS